LSEIAKPISQFKPAAGTREADIPQSRRRRVSIVTVGGLNSIDNSPNCPCSEHRRWDGADNTGSAVRPLPLEPRAAEHLFEAERVGVDRAKRFYGGIGGTELP
jgi:hypothetical protein